MAPHGIDCSTSLVPKYNLDTVSSGCGLAILTLTTFINIDVIFYELTLNATLVAYSWIQILSIAGRPERVSDAFKVSSRRGSNSQPSAWQADTLPIVLLLHKLTREKLNKCNFIYQIPQLRRSNSFMATCLLQQDLQLQLNYLFCLKCINFTFNLRLSINRYGLRLLSLVLARVFPKSFSSGTGWRHIIIGKLLRKGHVDFGWRSSAFVEGLMHCLRGRPDSNRHTKSQLITSGFQDHCLTNQAYVPILSAVFRNSADQISFSLCPSCQRTKLNSNSVSGESGIRTHGSIGLTNDFQSLPL